MEYTEIDAYPIAGGDVVLWDPSVPADDWVHDVRMLGANQRAHLSESDTGSWIGSIMTVPRPHHAGAVRRALRAWCARHEALRATVDQEQGVWTRLVASRESVDVTPTDLGHVPAGEVNELLERSFSQVSPHAFPHCRFATVTTDDEDSFVLAFGADHGVMDAYSQLLWFDEILALYDAALDGTPEHVMHRVDCGSHVDFAHREHVRAASLTREDTTVRRWDAFIGPERRFDAVAWAPLHGSGTAEPQHSSSTWIADAQESARIAATARREGIGMQALVTAAFARTLRALSGTDSLRLVLPMHTRSSPEDASAVGWYVGLCPVEVPVTPGEGLHETGRRADEVTRRNRDLAATPFERVAELLAIDDAPRLVASYVDVRHVPGAERWPELRARTLRSRTVSDDEVYLWVVRSAEGMSVSCRAPAGTGAAVATLVSRLAGELARTGQETDAAEEDVA